jgi:hypothetical protein
MESRGKRKTSRLSARYGGRQRMGVDQALMHTNRPATVDPVVSFVSAYRVAAEDWVRTLDRSI